MLTHFHRAFEDAACSNTMQYAGALNGACLTVSVDGMDFSLLVAYPSLNVYFGSSCTSAPVYVLDIPNTGMCVETVPPAPPGPGPQPVPVPIPDIPTLPELPYSMVTLGSSVTASPTESGIPSVAPTRMPTASDTTMPTQPLSTGQSLTYYVSQALDGVDSGTYYAELDLNNQAVSASVAASMSGVDSSNVAVKTVSSTSSASTSSFALATAETWLNYSVTIPNTATAGYSSASQAYNATTAALLTDLSSGVFTSTLRSTAFSLGASSLTNASSTSAVPAEPMVGPVDGTDGGDDDDEGLGPGAIAGVVIGAIALLAIIAAACYCFCKSPSQEEIVTVTATVAPPPAVGMDANPMASPMAHAKVVDHPAAVVFVNPVARISTATPVTADAV